MKTVVAIIGSPRKGETWKAVQRLEQEMKKLGEVQFEYVMLSDLALRDCTGCHNCFMRGQETCREAAKVKEMQDRMMAADAVVLSSPVYNQGVTAIMKKFLDYFTFLWHRPAMFGVKFFGLASGGGMFKEVFQTMKTNVHSWGGTWAGELGVPHYEALTEKHQAKADKSFAAKAAALMKVMDDQALPRPGFMRLMSYRMWKLNASLGFCPKDRQHWGEQGWLDPKCRYFYSVRINPFTNAAAALAAGMARRFLRGVYRGY